MRAGRRGQRGRWRPRPGGCRPTRVTRRSAMRLQDPRVVGDEEQADGEVPAQPDQEVDRLLLDHHVEAGRRFVRRPRRPAAPAPCGEREARQLAAAKAPGRRSSTGRSSCRRSIRARRPARTGVPASRQGSASATPCRVVSQRGRSVVGSWNSRRNPASAAGGGASAAVSSGLPVTRETVPSVGTASSRARIAERRLAQPDGP